MVSYLIVLTCKGRLWTKNFFGARLSRSFQNCWHVGQGNIVSFSTFALLFLKIMYAIVDISGKQFKVEKDQYIYAPKLSGDAGSSVTFDRVLLVEDEGKVTVGAPTVSGVKVSGKILEHVKSDKVIVFKKKRRKGYAVKNGHRQQFTKVQIDSIA